MIARSTSLLLVFAIAVAPLICCGYGLGSSHREDSCAAADRCCNGSESASASESESSVPADRPCDEVCQCVCFGAVIESLRGDELFKGGWWAPGLELVGTRRRHVDSAAGRTGDISPDPVGDNPGRALRTRYQSFLC